ncbi:vWA domain-containing protein [Bordetella genomosp. 13]|uniref:vWA domain-containing protein n=1 Tax=Bordetella genomosp. 13 TaxID=463040 RepID=UPI0011A92D3B|nr:vWA domain-containing protein [Bordetella genomosp. 13]
MQKMMKLRGLAVALLIAGILTGCGGSDDDDDDNPSETPTQPGNGGGNGNGGTDPGQPSTGTRSLSGTLVVPESARAQTASVMSARSSLRASSLAAAVTCDAVPTSYQPLAQATISFTDAGGNPVNATLTTDDCGAFSGTVPDTAAFAIAKGAGYRDLTVPVASFDANSADPTNLTSLLPDVAGATYRVASVQWTGADLSFTVVDSVTGKAVLGIPKSAVQYTVAGGNATDLSSLVYAAAQAGAASVVLALDASGSMDSPVYDSTGTPVKDANGLTMTLTRMAGLASHVFIDGKNADDEVGIVVFDDRTDWIDKTYFDGAGLKSAGGAYDAGYPADGFSKDPNVLRLPVDYYNDRSQIWGDSAPDALHAPLPADLRATGSYPWGGTTAIYDAGKLALDHMDGRSNPRKVAVLMTDGSDNDSSISAATLVQEYQAKNIPLWTVSFGLGASTTVLQELADQTGGNYVSSTDASQLAAAFAGIQTGIVFQYTGDLGLSDADFNAARGKELTLSVTYSGLAAARTVQVPLQ